MKISVPKYTHTRRVRCQIRSLPHQVCIIFRLSFLGIPPSSIWVKPLRKIVSWLTMTPLRRGYPHENKGCRIPDARKYGLWIPSVKGHTKASKICSISCAYTFSKYEYFYQCIYIIEIWIFLSSVWTKYAKSNIEGVEDRNIRENLDFASKHCDFAQYQYIDFNTIDEKWKPTSTLVWHMYNRLLTPCDSQVLKGGQFPYALRDGATQSVVP